MPKEINIDEMLEKINGGFDEFNSLNPKELLAREIMLKTYEIAGDIISNAELTTLFRYIFKHCDLRSAMDFARNKMNDYGVSSPKGKKFKELVEYYASSLLKFTSL